MGAFGRFQRRETVVWPLKGYSGCCVHGSRVDRERNKGRNWEKDTAVVQAQVMVTRLDSEDRRQMITYFEDTYDRNVDWRL